MTQTTRISANAHSTQEIDPIPTHVLEEAATWLQQMQDGLLAPARQREFECWRARSADHQRAWMRAERLLERIGVLPPALAKRALDRPGRRTTLRAITLLLTVTPLGWLAWRYPLWHNWLASDYLTAIGERRDITLEDGAQISLNSDTSLDVRYDSRLRLLHLRRGEVYVRTAADTHTPPRPFLLQSDEGQLVALGTRYSARQGDGYTELAVYEGAVQIQPRGVNVTPAEYTLTAGQRARFTCFDVGTLEFADESALAWRRGLLIADDMPIKRWAQELTRYGRDSIEPDMSVEDMRISGSFPIDNIPLALGMLTQTYRLRTHRDGLRVRITR